MPPRDPDALADRLVRILSDPELAHRMGQAARARVEDAVQPAGKRVGDRTRTATSWCGGPEPADRPVRLTVVLDLTSVGGAEILLLNLFKHFDPKVVAPRLVCLREAGPLADDFRAAGFDVEVLGRSGRFDVRTLPRLIRSFRRAQYRCRPGDTSSASFSGPRANRRALARVPVNLVAAHDMDLTSIGQRVLPRWAVNTLAIL